MALRAGQLRTPLTIQHIASVTRDETGGEVPVWGAFARLMVKLDAAEAREYEALRRRVAEADFVAVARFTTGVTPKMRAVLGVIGSTGTPASTARVFDILEAVDPDNRRSELHLALKERDLG